MKSTTDFLSLLLYHLAFSSVNELILFDSPENIWRGNEEGFREIVWWYMKKQSWWKPLIAKLEVDEEKPHVYRYPDLLAVSLDRILSCACHIFAPSASNI